MAFKFKVLTYGELNGSAGKYKTPFWRNLRYFLLIFIVSISLASIISVWISSDKYINSELERAGYGSLTAWVSGVSDISELSAEISPLSEISSVESQEIIYTDYTANGQESDSEGQLIKYCGNEKRYNFFNNYLTGFLSKTPEIKSGEIYISPSMISMFDIKIGDVIYFAIAREGGSIDLIVAGFYEDPFMSSSMIGMKGFLICPEDHKKISETIENSGINALAKSGAMLHIFAESDMNISEINNIINAKTSLPDHTEFVHSKEAICGFMLVLHNTFAALLLLLALFIIFKTRSIKKIPAIQVIQNNSSKDIQPKKAFPISGKICI